MLQGLPKAIDESGLLRHVGFVVVLVRTAETVHQHAMGPVRICLRVIVGLSGGLTRDGRF